jgi:hypothetical protein
MVDCNIVCCCRFLIVFLSSVGPSSTCMHREGGREGERGRDRERERKGEREGERKGEVAVTPTST